MLFRIFDHLAPFDIIKSLFLMRQSNSILFIELFYSEEEQLKKIAGIIRRLKSQGMILSNQTKTIQIEEVSKAMTEQFTCNNYYNLSTLFSNNSEAIDLPVGESNPTANI
jgi:hypothetical protein